MERRRRINCTHPSSCATCSLFTFTDPFFKTVVDIDNQCTKEYEYPAYKPITEVKINGNLEDEFNQTRCCEGSRTLVYTIEERTDELTSFTATTNPLSTSVETTNPSSVFFTAVTGDLKTTSVAEENVSANHTTILPSPTTSQSVDIPLLLSAGIVGVVSLFVIVLLCVIVVKCKRKSKAALGIQNHQHHFENVTYSDGVVEYSTVEETAPIAKSLIHTKTKSRGTENEDNYFILEKTEDSSNACEKTYKAKRIPSIHEDIYNKLHEKERKSTGIEENIYSHFSDCNENIYNDTFRN